MSVSTRLMKVSGRNRQFLTGRGKGKVSDFDIAVPSLRQQTGRFIVRSANNALLNSIRPELIANLDSSRFRFGKSCHYQHDR